MSRVSIFLALLIFLTSCSNRESIQPTGDFLPALTPSPAPSPTIGMPPKVRAYLDEVTGIVQENALNADEVDWENELDYIYQREQEAKTTADVYDSVLYILLLLKDNHSRFFFPEDMDSFNKLSPESVENPPITGEIQHEQYAYLKVPPFASGDINVNLQFGVELRELVATLNQQNPCAWVIDLRENLGGNLPPMIVGLAPLIGDGVIGSFQHSDETREHFSIENGVNIEQGVFDWNQVELQSVEIQPTDLPIAILIGPQTASSGEILALTFNGLPNVVYFGQETAGLTTGNSRFDLSDGSMILLTTSVFVDRLGQAYTHGFSPDVPLESIYAYLDEIPPEVQDWLETQDSCLDPDS